MSFKYFMKLSVLLFALLYVEALFAENVINFSKTKVIHYERDNSYNPPPYNKKAKRARYMMHNINWVSLATISSQFSIVGNPFSNIASIADGPSNYSTGIPYFYVSEYDTSVKDAHKNNNISITLSEMQTPFCEANHYIAEYPTCARLTLCGNFEKLISSEEKVFAKNALFSHFPVMKSFPKNHRFFFAKLNIKLIWLIDYFGGGYLVPIEEYFKADPLK